MLDMQEILSLIDSTNNRPLSVFKLKLYLLTKIFQVWLGQANVFGDATGEAKLAHLCVVCSWVCYHGDNFDDYSEMVMSDQSRERPQMLICHK